MKRYDGLFILNSVGHEDSVEKMIEGVSTCITDAGGTVDKVDKLETKSFARIASKKYKSGFYFSVIFEISIEGFRKVQAALAENEDVFRSYIQIARETLAETEVEAVAAE